MALMVQTSNTLCEPWTPIMQHTHAAGHHVPPPEIVRNNILTNQFFGATNPGFPDHFPVPTIVTQLFHFIQQVQQHQKGGQFHLRCGAWALDMFTWFLAPTQYAPSKKHKNMNQHIHLFSAIHPSKLQALPQIPWKHIANAISAKALSGRVHRVQWCRWSGWRKSRLKPAALPPEPGRAGFAQEPDDIMKEWTWIQLILDNVIEHSESPQCNCSGPMFHNVKCKMNTWMSLHDDYMSLSLVIICHHIKVPKGSQGQHQWAVPATSGWCAGRTARARARWAVQGGCATIAWSSPPPTSNRNLQFESGLSRFGKSAHKHCAGGNLDVLSSLGETNVLVIFWWMFQ